MEAACEKRMKELEQIRDNAKNVREYRRALVLIMLFRGYDILESSKILGLSRTSIYKWLKEYRRGGVQVLKEKPKKGRPAKFEKKFLDALRRIYSSAPSAWGYEKKHWTLQLLKMQLEETTGISISIEHLRRLLNKIQAD